MRLAVMASNPFLLEHGRRSGIVLPQALGEIGIHALVFLLEGIGQEGRLFGGAVVDAAVGHQRRHEDASPLRDPSQ